MTDHTDMIPRREHPCLACMCSPCECDEAYEAEKLRRERDKLKALSEEDPRR
jgi:hypothetical protein